MQRAEMQVAGAGSSALRALLHGPAVPGGVVHAGRRAVYAELPTGVVGVLARGAVHVPCAIATTLPDLPEVAVGDPAVVGDGLLRIGPLRVAVTRLVSFAVPRLASAPALDELLLADLSPARDQLPADALDLLAAGDPGAVPILVGRGDGLTPVGDDVLAGWLVATRAHGGDPSAVAAAVEARLPRTTSLSAALLRHAVAGEAIAPFRAALATGDADAVAALLAVGHTSGAGMLLGARLAPTSSTASTHSTSHQALEGSPR
ncbi:DUF2877 domain-containing protein [Nocardioides albidus]|uniref:DUF2877 domain-containing protein n=1 Tax=Nocardioides albidus TaxID=1517589 RepID=A0A5C4VYN2_9ACTN|nr:DUF2877 domain-containing protein [Nocardioides albidus]TNM40416.1 DUF2877 domain-containing protein [Nocardioides albidus]